MVKYEKNKLVITIPCQNDCADTHRYLMDSIINTMASQDREMVDEPTNYWLLRLLKDMMPDVEELEHAYIH